MYRIIALFVLCLSTLNDAVITDCGSEIGSIDKVAISDCDPTADKCILRRGKNVSIDIDFTIKQPVQSVTTVVHGVFMGVPVPFKVPHAETCDDPASGITCPLSSDGRTFHYKATLPVQQSYPVVRVDVKWELHNEAGIDIACLLIPAKIQ